MIRNGYNKPALSTLMTKVDGTNSLISKLMTKVDRANSAKSKLMATAQRAPAPWRRGTGNERERLANRTSTGGLATPLDLGGEGCPPGGGGWRGEWGSRVDGRVVAPEVGPLSWTGRVVGVAFVMDRVKCPNQIGKFISLADVLWLRRVHRNGAAQNAFDESQME